MLNAFSGGLKISEYNYLHVNANIGVQSYVKSSPIATYFETLFSACKVMILQTES